MWTLDDVITAVASPPGPGQRGIVRVTGPGVQSVVGPLVSEDLPTTGRARRISTSLQLTGLTVPLPAAAYIWPDQRCYAGQPTIELHTLSSPPLLNAIVEELVRHGARIARPGEFTLRAFLNGKIDLVQAEAVLGVIDADSTVRLQQALTQLAGGVSGRLKDLREQLLIDLADLEAGLDFVEEDIEFVDRAAMTARLDHGVEWLSQLASQAHSRGQTTGRKTVVLAGLPNAGKSTLFNALAGRDAAVVSPQAGTTRDWLTAPLVLDGVTADLVDTAGAEAGESAISADAQKGREMRMADADVVVWCSAANASPDEQQLDEEQRQEAATHVRGLLRLITRSDEGQPGFLDRLGTDDLAVSARTGAGVADFRARLRRLLIEDGDGGELLSTSLARCGESLLRAREALELAAAHSREQAGEELVAHELRRGLQALGEVAGVVYTDDLLDRIFSRFCIGK